MRSMRFLGFGIITMLLFFILSPDVFAACNRGALLPACTCDGNCTLGDMVVLFVNITRYALGILGVVSILFFIQGGIRMIMARGIQEHISSARKQISGTVVGLAIVLLAWVLVNGVIVAFTGSQTGTVFEDGTAEKKWWTLDYTPECSKSGFSCKNPANSTSSGTCESSKYCGDDEKCCL